LQETKTKKKLTQRPLLLKQLFFKKKKTTFETVTGTLTASAAGS
jgi:hypothetical protein